MSKIILLLIGLIFLAIGAYLGYMWWTYVVGFLAAALVCVLVILGLIIIVLSIGEISIKKK